MKLFGNIVIAVLISQSGFAFAQSTTEKEITTDTAPTEKVEKSKTERAIPADLPIKAIKDHPSARSSKSTKKKKVETKTPINGIKKQTRVGYLIAIDDNEFVIDLGSNDGLKADDAVEFFEVQRKGFGDEEVTVLNPITLGQVLEVTKKHARVHIPLNVVVPVGSAVMKANLPYLESRMHQEKPTGTEFALTVRPFIPLDTLGIGAVIDLEATHRFANSPLAVALVLSPIAFAITDSGRPNFMTFYGQVSYDAKYFEIGLGGGGVKTNKFGVSATQFLRLGTHDGLNLKATTYLIGIEKFKFHGVKIAAQVPTNAIFKNTWLIGRMGVQNEGQRGLGYGELGVRTLIKGRGTSGTIFLTPFLGGVTMTDTRAGTPAQCDYYDQGSSCKVERRFAGPSAGLTVEWRP